MEKIEGEKWMALQREIRPAERGICSETGEVDAKC